MMPGAGLYLPETLSQSLHNNEESSEVQQQAAARKTSQESDPDSRSATFTRSISEDMLKAFSSLSTVFDFADWASAHGKSSSESEVFVNLIQRVRNDVTEALRLSTSSTAVTDYLEAWPDKRIWIDSIIQDVQKALNDIGVFMETVRVSGDDGGTVSLRRRKYDWIMSHQKKLVNKQQYLMLCHQSLMAAVQVMQTAEMRTTFDPIYELPGPPLVRDSPGSVLRSPRSRQKIRMIQKNASVPSITVSEPEIHNQAQDKIYYYGVNAQPYRHALSELPGSTPDDLPGLVENDFQKYTHKRRTRSMDEGRAVPVHQSEAIAGQHFQPTNTRAISMIQEAKPSSNERLPDPPVYRGSFDSARPSTTSSFEDRARASFEHARHRSNSDQVRPAKTPLTKGRASVELVNTLPTVSEKPIESLMSSASVTINDALSMSLSSANEQPSPVLMKTPPVKHRPVPSKLPSLTSQTSLMEDLFNYVDPQPSQPPASSVGSVDTDASLHEATPTSPTMPVSVLSESSALCSTQDQTIKPVTPIATPEDDVDSMKNPVTSDAQLRKQNSMPAQPIREAPLPPVPARTPPSTPKFQSEVESPLKSPASEQERGGATHPSVVPNSPSMISRRPVATMDSPANSSEEHNEIVVPSSSRVCSGRISTSFINKASETNLPEGRPAAEETQSYTPNSEDTTFLQSANMADIPPPVPPKDTIPLPQAATLPKTTSASTASPVRPLTAQARRRAAHARRMELASESEK